MKKRICVDMDHVICDLITTWVEKYNEIYKDNVTVDQITMWDWHVITHAGLDLYKLLTPDLFENLPVIPDSQEVIKELMEVYDVFIVTAASKAEVIPAKSRWLKKHFPFIPKNRIVYTVDKSICLADFLIDDKPENLETFRGKGLLLSAAHNQNENRFHRVSNWLEIRDLLL